MVNKKKQTAAQAPGFLDGHGGMPRAVGSVVVVSDGRMGHQRQSEGVAAALGFAHPTVMTLQPKVNLKLWGWLPVGMCFGNLDQIPDADVVIGTGYQVSRVLRMLRGHGRFVVALQRPSGALGAYDAVALPAHDVSDTTPLPPNVVATTGAPNGITKPLLEEEADRWRARLAHLPEPRLAVMIGGPSRHGDLSEDSLRAMLDHALRWAEAQGGSLMISTSRRTGPALTEAARRVLAETPVPHYFYVPMPEDNPYFAFLALSEGVLMTHESVSMASEAATAGVPVYGWGEVGQLPEKFQRFYALLQAQHRWAPWPMDDAPTFRRPRQPLNDAALVAGFVQGRWMVSGR